MARYRRKTFRTDNEHIRNQLVDMIRARLEDEGVLAVVEPAAAEDTLLIQTLEVKKHVIVEDAP